MPGYILILAGIFLVAAVCLIVAAQFVHRHSKDQSRDELATGVAALLIMALICVGVFGVLSVIQFAIFLKFNIG